MLENFAPHGFTAVLPRTKVVYQVTYLRIAGKSTTSQNSTILDSAELPE